MYSIISQSPIIISPIGFNIALTNVNARLKQRCTNVVSTLCSVVFMLFQRRILTLYQRCATLKIRSWILFHFQRRFNVISTLIHKVETTLIQRWNFGWVRGSSREMLYQELCLESLQLLRWYRKLYCFIEFIINKLLVIWPNQH